MDQDDDYTIGYGKPPKATRFRKGRSGNPKGRPKTPTDPDSYLLRELNKTIIVTEDGQRKRIPRGEAVAKGLVKKTLLGDLAALRILYRQMERIQVKLDADVSVEPVDLRTADPKDLTDEQLAYIILEAQELKSEDALTLTPDKALAFQSDES